MPTSFKASVLQNSVDALTHRLELSKGEVLKIHCNFANEFCLLAETLRQNIVWN
ncbi:hypothetical protein HMPREF9554_01314 [Treponema phagedenis F0421]|nr:hypothetical protein HMPREF9554_01314 [Treponema phagedenis F0421]